MVREPAPLGRGEQGSQVSKECWLSSNYQIGEKGVSFGHPKVTMVIMMVRKMIKMMIFGGMCARDQTQGLLLVRQVLCAESYPQ